MHNQFVRYLCLLLVFLSLSAHDLFIRMDTYYVAPKSTAYLSLYSGTFEKSENAVDTSRMRNVTLIGGGKEWKPGGKQWQAIKTPVDTFAQLRFETGKSGTYLAGVSTKPRMINLSAKDFNNYLEHDGVVDMLAQRKSKGEADMPAREEYSKHVKALIQVGGKRTDDYKKILGYPAEIVPVQNPYDLSVGDTLAVQILWKGKPLANYPIYAGGIHIEDPKPQRSGDHAHEDPARTDAKGIAKFWIDAPGRWYIRCIYMERVQMADKDYISNWATLSFEIK